MTLGSGNMKLAVELPTGEGSIIPSIIFNHSFNSKMMPTPAKFSLIFLNFAIKHKHLTRLIRMVSCEHNRILQRNFVTLRNPGGILCARHLSCHECGS